MARTGWCTGVLKSRDQNLNTCTLRFVFCNCLLHYNMAVKARLVGYRKFSCNCVLLLYLVFHWTMRRTYKQNVCYHDLHYEDPFPVILQFRIIFIQFTVLQHSISSSLRLAKELSLWLLISKWTTQPFWPSTIFLPYQMSYLPL